MEINSEMHISPFESILQKGGNKFYTFKELAEASNLRLLPSGAKRFFTPRNEKAAHGPRGI